MLCELNRGMLQFYVNGKKRIVRNTDPTQTVLQWVRSVGLTGSKLGCQEGGCGACTMTLSEWDPVEEKPIYRAINGCIVPLIAVDGKHLITIEGLGDVDSMHPAQERIGKFHGSQCGFCTPGIVMSLYSLLRTTDGKPTKEMISEAFDGNLCRCTGYKPIIDAAYTFVNESGTAKIENGNGTASQENGMCAMGDKCCKNKANGVKTNGVNGTNGCSSKHDDLATDFTTPDGQSFKKYDAKSEFIFPPALKKASLSLLKIEYNDVIYYRPTTLKELKEIKEAHPSAKMVSGASEVQIEMKIKGDQHPVSVFMNDIAELKTFEYIEDKGVIVGGNIPLSDMEHHLEKLSEKIGDEKSQTYKAITKQLKFFAGRQIRNVASPAGNIATASPIADLNPILVAANATVFVDVDGKEVEIPMGDLEKPFFTGYRRTLLPPGGIITKIFIPVTKKGEFVHSYKQAKRKDDDISIVTAAMRAQVAEDGTIEAASLAYGGVAPITVLAKTSKTLVGKKLNDELLSTVLNDLAGEFNLPYSVPGGMAMFRRSLILSFFYMFYQTLQKEMGYEYDKTSLMEVTRDFSTGERDLTNKFKANIVGNSDVHLSALKQVTGEAQYVDDIPPMHNELHGVQVLATKAHAKIKSVDWSAALELEGVEGYVTAADVPGENKWGAFITDGPDYLFCEDNMVNYAGDNIGMICATSADIAAKAARLVKVEYEELPHILTIEEAIEHESYFPFFPTIDKGDPEKAFSEAEYVFEGSSRQGAQEHFYLEPQGALVVPEEGKEFKVYASSQNPNETQLVVASALGIPANRVVARVKRLGGGFGGKETRTCHYSSIAAVAAYKFKRPVRIIPSRYDDMAQAGQRHPFLSKWKVALDKNYRFTALDVNLYANAGYSMDLTKGVMDRAVLHADNCYDFQNCHIKCWPCKTNIASNTAFRGFGGPQGMFAAESIIFTVAEKLGIDYDELRRINYYNPETGVTPYQQKVGIDFSVPLMAEKNLKAFGYEKARKEVDEFNAKSKWIKRGLAHVPTKFGVAFGVLWLNQAGALIHIYEDGSVLVSHGGTEMGQGLHTKMAMIAAEELQVPLENVFISETSTNTVANASPSAASASSDLNGGAVKNACDQLNARLQPYRELFDGDMHKMAKAAYLDRVNLSANGFYKTPDIGYVFGDPNPKPAFLYYTQGSAIAMVEVNTLTGDWANLRTDIIMDVGRSINQAIDYGQIEGAFVQGQGLYTMEESLWFQNGSLFTRGPGNYKIPGFRDIPQNFNVSIYQDRDFNHLKTVHKSKGIGEPPLFLGSTVMFAIRDALKSAREARGLKIDPFIEAPMTSERIRIATGDELVEKVEVEKVGKPFLIRA